MTASENKKIIKNNKIKKIYFTPTKGQDDEMKMKCIEDSSNGIR